MKIKKDAKSCLKVLAHLIKLNPSTKITFAELFNTQQVDFLKYFVKYPFVLEGEYWTTPRTRETKSFFIKPETILIVRDDSRQATVDVNFDWKNKDIVVTITRQHLNEKSGRLHLLPSPKIRGGLGDVVKEIKRFYEEK